MLSVGLCLPAGLPAGFLVFLGLIGALGGINDCLIQFQLLPCGAVQPLDFFDHIVGMGSCDTGIDGIVDNYHESHALQEKQGIVLLLQLHVSIQQSGERLLYRSPLFVLILSAVYPFAAGWISDFSGWFCGAI